MAPASAALSLLADGRCVEVDEGANPARELARVFLRAPRSAAVDGRALAVSLLVVDSPTLERDLATLVVPGWLEFADVASVAVRARAGKPDFVLGNVDVELVVAPDASPFPIDPSTRLL